MHVQLEFLREQTLVSMQEVNLGGALGNIALCSTGQKA